MFVCSVETIGLCAWSSPAAEIVGILGSWCHRSVWGRCGYIHEERGAARFSISRTVFDELDSLSTDDISEVVLLVVIAMSLHLPLVGDFVVVELAVCMQ